MASKIWIFAKYNNMICLDKNPDGDDGNGPVDNVQLWEKHVRVLMCHGLRRKGGVSGGS